MTIITNTSRQENLAYFKIDELRPDEITIALIAGFEGFMPTAYQDATGRWTCGYGHTARVKADTTCTEALAKKWLRDDLHQVEQCINRSVKVAMTQNEYDALCSWIYNLGCHTWNQSRALQYLNNGDSDLCIDHMSLYNMAGGHRLEGLVRRRSAERRLWLTGKIPF